MKGRTQVIKFNDILSSERSVPHGVPQGTVLGPLLFIIFINDLHKCLKHCNIFKFADDTLLTIDGVDFEDTVGKLNEDLTAVVQWLQANSLKLNTDKSAAILFTTSKLRRQQILNAYPNTKVCLDGIELPFQDCTKYLGIQIDYLLNFKTHIDYIKKKIAKKVWYLQRIGRDLSKWSKNIIFNCIIAPHFEYCCTIMFNADKSEISELQKLQNRCMRVILGCDRRTHRVDMLQELNILSVEQKIAYKVLLFIYNLKKGRNSEIFSDFMVLNNDVHQHDTRSKNDFHFSNQNNVSSQKSLFINGLKAFNELPRNSLDLSIVKFKKLLFQFVKQKYPLK